MQDTGEAICPEKPTMHNVLIIDDSDINLTLIKALIQKIGNCNPLPFENPLEALAWCRQNIPDLVIIDYMMPEMDGMQFIRKFRFLPGQERIPVLMITANDQKDIRYEALENGASDFLNKPIDRIEFSARVRNMLQLRSAQKQLADRAMHLTTMVEEQVHEIRGREQELIYRLSRAAEFRDPETGAHIKRMAHYSQLIAQQLGMDNGFQKLVLEAAPLHDVGKIGIPDSILLKPGKLTEEEFEIMKGHSSLGFELLKDSASDVLMAGAEIALHHHEKFDGSGYPRGLAGESIAILGRIVAVADVFDALTSVRPYKKAWSLTEARIYLEEGRGKHFDPRCVDALLSGWDKIEDIRSRFEDDQKIKLPSQKEN